MSYDSLAGEDLLTLGTTGSVTILSSSNLHKKRVRVTGSLTSNASLVFETPFVEDATGPNSFTAVVHNSTSGSFTLTVKATSIDAGTQVTQGTSQIVWSDGVSMAAGSSGGGGGGSTLTGDVNGTLTSNHVDKLSGPGGGVAIQQFDPISLDFSSQYTYPATGSIRVANYASVANPVIEGSLGATSASILTVGPGALLVFGDDVAWNAQYTGNVLSIIASTEVVHQTNTTLFQSFGAHTNLTLNAVATGGSGSLVIAPDMQFILSQSAAAAASNCNSLTIAPQGPNANAGNAANGAAGSFIVSLASPVSGGAHGALLVKEGSNVNCYIGPWQNGATVGAIYLGPVTNGPGPSNYTMYGDGVNTVILNAPQTLELALGGSTVACNIQTTLIQFGVPSLVWTNNIASPTLNQSRLGGDSAPNNLTIASQGAVIGAQTFTTGSNLILSGGIGGSTSGSGGLVNTVGGQAIQLITVNTNYVCDTNSATSDYVIVVNASGGTRAITLPKPTVGRIITVKDNGSATTHNVTVKAGAATIDGAASVVFTKNFDSLTVISDGTNWFTMNEYSTTIVP